MESVENELPASDLSDLLALPEYDPDVPDEIDEIDESTSQECLWCEKARGILFGVAAIGIGLIFLAVGIDLATGGALTARLSLSGRESIIDDSAGDH